MEGDSHHTDRQGFCAVREPGILRKQKKRFTVENIIARWAPPYENDTAAYTRTVLTLSGLGGNENLLPPQNVQGYGRQARLMEAMTVMENGIRPVAVDTEPIRQGYDLASPAT